MKIESFAYNRSAHQGYPEIISNAQVSSRLKLRNFTITVKGLKGFNFSFKIVCTPEETYFGETLSTTGICFITDPANVSKKIDIIEFLKLHAKMYENINSFLTLFQSESTANCMLSTPPSDARIPDLETQPQELSLDIMQSESDKPLHRLDNQLSAKSFFSKAPEKEDIAEWIKQQLVPNYTSSSVLFGTTNNDSINITANIPTLILTDENNIQYIYTNVSFSQAANIPLSKNNLIFEKLETRELESGSAFIFK
ncbi:MAG: hypothetical protein EPN84_02520 [Legionella sp.]|nr:MAG: hypothetical protein EPN84_02520 [Legionella sp.]